MTYLNSNQLKQYSEEGYVAPLDILTKEEALEARNEIELIEKNMPNEIEKSGRYNVHLISPKLDAIVNNSKILSHINAFDNSKLAVDRQCSGAGSGAYGCLGMVYITEFNTANSFAGGLHVKTCYKEPCSNNFLWDQINVYPD